MDDHLANSLLQWSKREEDLKDSQHQDYSNLSEDCLRLISALKPGLCCDCGWCDCLRLISALKPGLCPNLSEDCLRLEEHEVAEPAGDPDPDQHDDMEVRLLLLDMDKAEETSGDTAAHDLENIDPRQLRVKMMWKF